ncbi:hypothetical protein niasHT_020843 [Heterodera trifolii]|uniref:Uncharacterized protein n=1 Tax=Heterodera trifolii TaxID=157864 RepID=A0ABD2KLJ6_9BILA
MSRLRQMNLLVSVSSFGSSLASQFCSREFSRAFLLPMPSSITIILPFSPIFSLVVVCAIVVICCLCRKRRAGQDNDELSTAVPSSYYKSRQGPTDSMDWLPPSTAGHGHGRGGRSGGGGITAVPSGMMSKMPTTKTKQPFSFRMLMPESLRSIGPSIGRGGAQTKLKTTTMLGGGDQTKLKTTTMLGGGDQTKLKASTVPSGGEHYTTW